MSRIAVLVADDHTIVRDGLVAILEAEPDVDVVARASNGEDAAERIEALRPDVAVVDIAMPRMTGIEVARKVRDQGLGTAVVLLSVHKEAALVREGLDAGASGYVLKTSETAELVQAVRAAAAGDVFLSPQVTQTAIAALRESEPAGAPALSPRVRDDLRLLARGLSSKEIAARLGIAWRTVDTNRAEIMSKLGIHHVPGHVKYALRHQLAMLDDDDDEPPLPHESSIGWADPDA